jgi:hypothetical protein
MKMPSIHPLTLEKSQKKYVDKKVIALAISIVIMVILVYRFTLYMPPLLDAGKRNLFDKTIDFFSCGWHLAKGSYFEEYKKNYVKAKRQYFMAGWYRELYLIKAFHISKDDIAVFLGAHKKENSKNIKDLLFELVISTPASRAAILKR